MYFEEEVEVAEGVLSGVGQLLLEVFVSLIVEVLSVGPDPAPDLLTKFSIFLESLLFAYYDVGGGISQVLETVANVSFGFDGDGA